MDWSWVAEIAVSLGNNRFSIRTGVLVKKDLVLTAGHGLDKEQVKVRMVGRFQKGQKEWLDADVIWNGENGEEQQIDAAILKLSEPVTDIAPCPEQRRTDAGETWKGLGFPGGSTTQIGERTFRDTRELGGTYREGGGMRGGTLQLTEPSEIKDKEKWKGISGAPVLVDGVLVGIVKSVDDQFKTTEFAGVPLEKILEFEKVKEFWKRVDEEGKNFFEKVRRETIADLEKCSGLFAALAAKEKLAEGKKSPEKMADILLNLPVFDFQQTLKEVFTVPEQSKEVKICIKEILNMALPVLYFRGETAASFFSSTNVPETRLLVAFVGTKTVAEILMAFLDKRPTSWVPGDRHPVGSACVPSPPENGIGFTGNQTECDFVTYLKEKLLNAEDLKTLSEGEIVEIINDELEYVKTSGDPFPFQHYCLIELGDQQQEHSFSGLMDKFKDLLFLALDRKSVREERRLTRPLVDLFPGNNRKEIV